MKESFPTPDQIQKKTPPEPGSTTDVFEKEDFELEKELDLRKGPVIEIAGPTTSGFRDIDIQKLSKKLIVTNLTLGIRQYDPKKNVGSSL